jgi:hypothetical protein
MRANFERHGDAHRTESSDGVLCLFYLSNTSLFHRDVPKFYAQSADLLHYLPW